MLHPTAKIRNKPFYVNEKSCIEGAFPLNEQVLANIWESNTKIRLFYIHRSGKEVGRCYVFVVFSVKTNWRQILFSPSKFILWKASSCLYFSGTLISTETISLISKASRTVRKIASWNYSESVKEQVTLKSSASHAPYLPPQTAETEWGHPWGNIIQKE